MHFFTITYCTVLAPSLQCQAQIPSKSLNSKKAIRSITNSKNRQPSNPLFLTANEIYFICKGKHCLRISKDDKKISSVISGNPEESLAAKSEFEGIQQVMMTCRYNSGERNKILEIMLYRFQTESVRWVHISCIRFRIKEILPAL